MANTKTRRSQAHDAVAPKRMASETHGKEGVKSACPPWLKIPDPPTRTLRVYAQDPSAGAFIGNTMKVDIRWEPDLRPGPVGRRFAVIDYDGANKLYYPPVNLNDHRILAADGLEPSEFDPRFHQQMVYAVASETVEKFEAALGRSIRWRRADRPIGHEKSADPTDDIWVLKLYPHAMIAANAFYCREAQGILFGYFRATQENQGNNLPGQMVFTCLSHDIIAHEVTHAVIDGIRTFFTEPTNPDVLAFHEAFADLTALFLHFSHKEALLDTVRKTGGRLYAFELKPDAMQATAPTRADEKTPPAPDAPQAVSGLKGEPNPLIELAQQFGQACGMGHRLRSALDERPNPSALQDSIGDPHRRGSILVAAVFDAYFSIYLRKSADLFRIYRAGGASIDSAELPIALATQLTEIAAKTADEFFQLCARALDYCPPVDITFGDFLRALMTASADLRPTTDQAVRQALMQAFRARGIYPEDASYFSEAALCWPCVPDWSATSEDGDAMLPPVNAELEIDGVQALVELQFTLPGGRSRKIMDRNGDILRAYAFKNARRLGFDDDPTLSAVYRPYAPTFHQTFRTGPDGRLLSDMVVELVQTRLVPFDLQFPEAGTFPLRGGVTLIIAAPTSDGRGQHVPPKVRFAIRKPLIDIDGHKRAERQRRYALANGLAQGDTAHPHHFQADFNLLHGGA